MRAGAAGSERWSERVRWSTFAPLGCCRAALRGPLSHVGAFGWASCTRFDKEALRKVADVFGGAMRFSIGGRAGSSVRRRGVFVASAHRLR